MQPLTQKTLSSLSASVPTPTYDRDGLRTGIVHIGVGGFHRAHEAMYIDRLLEQGKAQDWAICGVGVLPSDRRMAEVMEAQDGLFTLVVKHPDGTLEPRVVGSIVEYLLAPDDPEAVVEKMAGEATQIVSLTVTEGGYNFSPVTGEFDAGDPDVMADLQPGAVPRTTFGLVTEALVRRRERGLAPFTVVSCDNIQGNGDVARRSFINSYGSTSSTSWTPASSSGGRPRLNRSSSTHCVKGSHTTGHPSSMPNRSRTSFRSSSVVAGVIRSTIELGKGTSRSTQAPSSGSRRPAKAVKLRRATSPLPWMLSHDTTVNGASPRARRRTRASVTSPNVVLGTAPDCRSAATSGAVASNSPVTGEKL